ncbi:FGGY family carbohydrate kinase [Subtercola vilae]|uniref:ATP:glycerol 3-phosphotransferase n=1 Tax=Subtercola vilae TaxID=2056433 RepID=A0A4T2CFE3_9MICO|nr:FGGY family carbohydrate kinase [Subtercola vilae]TIH40898.1 glycerol kinase [Subtercola vilae]
MPDHSGSPVVIAVDQGTSSTKVIAVDEAGRVIGSSSVALDQQHPHPGWVQQDARAILASVITGIEQASAGLGSRVVALALSSQRESAVAWSRTTGEPLGPMLGWQDRRTIAAAQALAAAGHGPRVRAITGLPLDPMFSALKFSWLLDQVDPDRSRSDAGEIALGTVDSYLLYCLTGGTEHRIEFGNASRTQLLDLETLDWSDELLALFDIPRRALPRLAESSEPSAVVTAVPSLPAGTRFAAVLGDSHAALYGHGVRTPGSVKVTLGTGSSIMGLLPPGRDAEAGLVTTIAWCTPETTLAFEGNILSSGSTATWLAGLLGVTPPELFALAESAAASASASPETGVDLVPAFAGLGAPWWDESAKAVMTGFDLGTDRASLALAAVESIALQIEDVLAAAESAESGRFETILIDGGPAANDFLAQLVADLSQRRVERPTVSGLSALGAAHLAGTVAGVWSDDTVRAFDRGSTVFEPQLSAPDARTRRERWLAAVATARGTRLPSLTSFEKETAS